jgi:transposase
VRSFAIARSHADDSPRRRLDPERARCRWPLGTHLIEGIDNRIKVIERMACGFRDDACFFLEIRAAFPGIR